MKFTDMNYQDVVFRECALHTMIRYAGANCPVCMAEAEKRLLENQIASLEIGRATAAAE